MEHLSVRDAYYQEEMIEAGKGKNAISMIWGVLVFLFVLAILFWIFNRGQACHIENAQRNGDHNCAVRERLGILEGQMQAVGTTLNPLVQNFNSTSQFVSAQLGGLNEYTKCASKEIGFLQSEVYRLDNAVYVPRCGEYRGCGCGTEGRGNRRFSEVSTFIPESSKVTVTESCVN